jgi:hypothetical protein
LLDVVDLQPLHENQTLSLMTYIGVQTLKP